MYGRLFGWIVNKVNQLLAPPLASRGEEVTEIGKSETGWFEMHELVNLKYILRMLLPTDFWPISVKLLIDIDRYLTVSWIQSQRNHNGQSDKMEKIWRNQSKLKTDTSRNGVTDQVKNNSSDDFEVSFKFCTWSVHKRMVGVF